jgi:hypothetical protein
MEGAGMSRHRKLVVGLAALLLALVGFVGWSPSPAAAQDIDLCDLLGDPYCPPDVGSGVITCDSTGHCTVTNVDVGDELTATLSCGDDFAAVVFDGVVDEVPFSFDFDVPAGAPPGPGSLSITGGTTLPFSCGGTLARTGSDVGPLLGISGGLIALGLAAAVTARRRLRTAEPV